MSDVLDPRDAHVFRVHTNNHESIVEGATTTREVTAAYYQHEHGFITFKDNRGGSLYMVREELVQQIERLRTHVILAVASEELGFIIDALHSQLATLDDIEPRDSTTAAKAKYHREAATSLVESLERLRPVASQRHVEDVSSLPRVAVGPAFYGYNAEGKLVMHGGVAQDAI